MKRLTALTFGIFLAFLAGAQVTTNPTTTGIGTNLATMVTGVLSPANGGTGVANNAAATLTRSGSHALTITTTGTTGVTFPTSGTIYSDAADIALTGIAQIATNTVAGNATSGTADITALAVGSCSTAGSALIWTTNSGFGCNTAIAASTATTATNQSGGTVSATTGGFSGEVKIGGVSDFGTQVLQVYAVTGEHASYMVVDASGVWPLWLQNTATSGDNSFSTFRTEAGAGTERGSITYNRVGGLVAYNTTSDYRAKDVFGEFANAQKLLSALKVYDGKMKDASLRRPMLIAHEAQTVTPWAVTGKKDAVDKTGAPVYQQLSEGAYAPLLISGWQNHEARIFKLETGLIKTIHEQQAQIDQLTIKVATIETGRLSVSCRGQQQASR